MTHCPSEDVLLDYTAGVLDAAKTALFERHADQCARCGALRASHAAVWRTLDDWRPMPVSAGFNRELWRRIDADARARSWSRQLAELMHVRLWKQAAPLAVAVALVVTGFLMDHSGRATAVNGHAPAVVVTVKEADQLERALDDIQLLDAVNTVSAVKPESGLM